MPSLPPTSSSQPSSMKPARTPLTLPTPSPAASDRRPRFRPEPIPLPRREPSSLAVPLPLPPPNSSSHLPAPSPFLFDLERVRRIGSGSGGTVYMALHRPSGRNYALKVIHGHHEEEVRHLIRREVEILRSTESPYVVRCHGFYDHAGEIQILLEYMDDGSLEGRRIVSEPQLAKVARHVLVGLAYLHRRRIVHRDIKPSNLLINSAGQVKIADFGVSRILAKSMDPCNSAVGTTAYMSPERIDTNINEGQYDGQAADIWSFGLSILEFYLGSFPFGERLGRQGDWASLVMAICYGAPPEPPPTASPELRSFVRCCLQKDPTRRLSAAQLLRHPFISQSPAMAVVTPPALSGLKMA